MGFKMVAVLALYVLTVLLSVDLVCSGRADPTPSSTHSACPMDKFDCRNGKCITGSHWCDGIDHCGNNADELSCRICLSGSVKCKQSTQCVPSGARCNGETECVDGSDELGCEMFTGGPSVATTLKPHIHSTSGSLSLSNGFLQVLARSVIILLIHQRVCC